MGGDDAYWDAIERMGDDAYRMSDAMERIAKSAKTSGKAITNVGKAAKASSVGMKILASAANIALTALVSFAASWVANKINEATHAFDNQIDKLNESKSAYEESENSIKSIETELSNVKERLEELNEIDNPTFVQQEEIDRLKQVTEELNAQLEAEKAIAAFNKSKVQSDFIAAVKQYQTAPNIAGVELDYSQETKANIAIEKHTGYIHSRNSKREELAKLMAVDESQRDYEAIQETKDKITEYEDKANTALLEAIDIYQTLVSAASNLERDEFNAPYFEIVDQLGLYISQAQAFAGEINQLTGGFDVLWNSPSYVKGTEKLQELAEKGELVIDSLSADPDISAFIAACEAIGLKADQVIAHINDQYSKIGEDPKPTTPDFSTTLSSLYKNTEHYTTLTDAIEEQASAGKISVDTMKALTDISPDFINYLEKTADGYAINTDALMEYIEAQDLMEKTKAINAIHDLNEELKDADITSDRRDQILAEIQKWEMLVYEIENATGALAKYKAASETENQDADFAVGKSIYELIKENRKIGKTGTDDFQAGVEFLLGEGWEEKYANDLKAAYKEAEEIGKKFFGQETESDNYKNFFNYLAKETDFAKFNELGQVVFDNVDLAAIAEEIGMSVDAVRSLFQLAEAYGNKIEYDFEVDATELEYAEAVINELEERRKVAQNELDKSKVGTEAYSRWSSQVNELDNMIDVAGRHAADMESDVALTIDGAIEKVAELGQYSKYLTEHGFEVPVSVTGDINALNGFLNNFELAKDDKGNTVGYTIEVENAEKASELIENLKGQMEEVQNNTDISDTMRATLTEQMQATVDSLQAYVDSGVKEAFTFALSIDENSAKLVDTLMAEDPDAIVLTVEVEPNAYQLAQEQINKLIEDKTLKIIPEVEDKGNVVGSTVSAAVDETNIANDNTVDNQQTDLHQTTTTIYSVLVDLVRAIHEATGAIPTPDQLESKYKSALESSEITIAPEDMENLPYYTSNAINDYTSSLDTDAYFSAMDAEINLDADKANDTINDLHENVKSIEEEELEIDILPDSNGNKGGTDFITYSEDILSMADAYGAAQSSQNAMKQSTEELKAALANLKILDPNDTLNWLAASEQLNNAVTNYQSAYITLASELEELAPVDVKANISSAKNSIESLNGKTVTVNVKANNTSTSTSSGGGLLSTIKGWFSGSSNASGTTYAKKGMSLVDEEGPELIEHVSEGTYELGTNKGPRFTQLNEGDVVHTASETKKILARMGGAIGDFFRDGWNQAKTLFGDAFAGGTTLKKKLVVNKNTSTTGASIVKKLESATSSFANSIVNTVNTLMPAKETASGLVDLKPTSGSSSKGSGSGSGSSSKSGKLDDYLSKLFDWIEVRLTRLQQSTDGWLAQVAEAVGYVAKNAKLDNALTSVAKQIDASTKAYSRYMQQAQEIADKFNLDPELIRLVQEGEIDIASYDEDTQKKIQAYQEW